MTDPLTSNERAISHERLQFLIRFAESYNATPGHPWADILFALKEYQTMFGSSPDEASNTDSAEVRRFRPWPHTEDYVPASDYERLRLERDQWKNRADAVERIPSNLVSKLREFHWYGPPVKGIDALLNEAADEVERLNALAGPSGKSLGELEAINDSLLEENERLRGSVPGVETREDRPVLVACPVCGKMDPECDEPGKCPYGPKAAKGEIKLLRQWVEDRDYTIAHWVTEHRRLGAELARLRADLDEPSADIQERVLRKVGLWPPASPVETSAQELSELRAALKAHAPPEGGDECDHTP